MTVNVIRLKKVTLQTPHRLSPQAIIAKKDLFLIICLIKLLTREQ